MFLVSLWKGGIELECSVELTITKVIQTLLNKDVWGVNKTKSLIYWTLWTYESNTIVGTSSN